MRVYHTYGLMLHDSSNTGTALGTAYVYNVSTGALAEIRLPVAVYSAEAIAFDNSIVLTGG